MAAPVKNVSIVSVNFNQPAVTEEMLASFFLHEQYSPVQFIIVDNGSSLNPVPVWRVKYPSVTFIRSDINTGFAGGNNIGLKEATGDYLFLVNNDTEFTPGLITQLVNTLHEHPETAIVSPKIRYYQQPDVLQYAGFTSMNFFTARNDCIGKFEKDTGQYDNRSGPTGYAHGAAMMIKKEAIEKAGLMKENYFLYYEEMDWCERIKRAGYDIRTNMQALIYHKESVSVGQKSALKEFFMNRNRILFIRRNAAWYQRWFFYAYFLLVVTPRNIISYIREGHRDFIPILFRAIWWNITHSCDSNELGYKLTTNI